MRIGFSLESGASTVLGTLTVPASICKINLLNYCFLTSQDLSVRNLFWAKPSVLVNTGFANIRFVPIDDGVHFNGNDL